MEKYNESFIREFLVKEEKDEDDKLKKDEKEETIAEKEILSLIEEGKIYFSLLSGIILIKEIKSKKIIVMIKKKMMRYS